MKLDDKLVDGIELEKQARLQQSELEKSDAEALATQAPLTDVDVQRRELVLAAMKAIVAGEHVVVDELRLPARELCGLAALQAATTGRDSQLSQFVYASDRRDLLEQALAILQPTIGELPGAFELLVQKVGELRQQLKGLEDAQDELLEANTEVAAAMPELADGDASLTGPERPEPAKPPSTLTGPALPEPAPAPTTLVGPAVPERAPEPTTLGDPKEIAAISATPWWKRSS